MCAGQFSTILLIDGASSYVQYQIIVFFVRIHFDVSRSIGMASGKASSDPKRPEIESNINKHGATSENRETSTKQSRVHKCRNSNIAELLGNYPRNMPNIVSHDLVRLLGACLG